MVHRCLQGARADPLRPGASVPTVMMGLRPVMDGRGRRPSDRT